MRFTSTNTNFPKPSGEIGSGTKDFEKGWDLEDAGEDEEIYDSIEEEIVINEDGSPPPSAKAAR